MNEYRKAWSSINAVDFYKSNRQKRGDIYRSEDYFLKRVLEKGDSILDVGCAVGGFSEILKTYRAPITYTGIDISAEMIKQAKIKYPEHKFKIAGGDKLPFPDNKFDLVICFGTIHMNLKWREVINESWRVAKRCLLFDLRITRNKTIENIKDSYQRIEFDDKWDGKSIVPYITVGIPEFFKVIEKLSPQSRKIMSYGYFHRVSPITNTPIKKLCMATFCLQKKGKSEKISWNLPINIPDGIA